MLLDDPARGGLFFVWGLAGIIGTRTLVQVSGGTYTDNTVPGLLAGIAAAAPLAFMLLQRPDWPFSLLPLYFTVSPIIVATGYIVGFVFFEPCDDARIVDYHVE